MARGKLWSVKGVSAEAREAARDAAKESGQPIGAWIDQAILMNGDDDIPNSDSEDTPPAPGDAPQPDIVAILQALEERVANHADRIAAQLAPVRDSIDDLGARLARLEERQAGTTGQPTPAPEPAPAPAPDTRPAGEPEHEPVREPESPHGAHSSDNPDPPSQSNPEAPETDIGDNAPAPEPAAPPSAEKPADVAPTDPGQITEADIHAADAALKSELTGLFDDGAHHRADGGQTAQRDPFLARRPPHRTSRAPLVFLLAILLAAAAGIAAVAWFEFLSPEMRNSITSQIAATTGEPDESVTAAPPPLPADPAAEPQALEPATPAQATAQAAAQAAAQAPTPEPAREPVSQTAPATSPPPAHDGSVPRAGTGEPPAIPSLGTPDALAAGNRAETGNTELDALRADAEAGIATAQNELGVRYLVGRGVAQDYAEAVLWLRKAAAQDMTNAQYNLGVLYDSGRGVESDPTEALIWFHSAAENGHGKAQMAMAAAYASGRGIARNPDEALKWLRRAAESNVPDAQFSLGNVLSGSPGRRESLSDAYVWYRIADANGVAKASARADQIAAQLTPEERVGANERVSHFISRKIPRAPKPAPATSPSPVAAPPPTPAPPAPPVPAAPAPTTPAADPVTRDQINAIQVLLAQLGFDPGAPDGAMGEQTRTAIRNYQRELGLPVDGQPSSDLLRHLRQIAGAR